MPIYEYQCQACGHRLESLQKISEDPLKDCPACGKPALNRLVSAAGFRLKGGGWYETDFKKDGDKKRNLADGGEGAKPSGDAKPSESAPAKAESTPAKTEAKPSSTPSA